MAKRNKNLPAPIEIQVGKYTTRGEDAQDQLALWHKLVDRRKKGTDEQTFRSIVAAILATRSHEGGFHLYKHTADKEIIEGYNAVLKALTGELCIRLQSQDVYKVKDTCPKLQVVSTGESNLNFQVKDKSLTVTWLNSNDIEPALVGMVSMVKPVLVDLPMLDIECAYQWCHLNIPISEHNRDAIPDGLPVRYRELEDIDPDLVKLGKVVSEDLVEQLQKWFLKLGYFVLLVKTETGAQLIVPETFHHNLADWWANNSLHTFQGMKLRQFIPVMQSEQALNQNLLGVGSNLTKERELAVAQLEAIKHKVQTANM